jgi:hypothetical protein
VSGKGGTSWVRKLSCPRRSRTAHPCQSGAASALAFAPRSAGTALLRSRPQGRILLGAFRRPGNPVTFRVRRGAFVGHTEERSSPHRSGGEATRRHRARSRASETGAATRSESVTRSTVRGLASYGRSPGRRRCAPDARTRPPTREDERTRPGGERTRPGALASPLRSGSLSDPWTIRDARKLLTRRVLGTYLRPGTGLVPSPLPPNRAALSRPGR